MFHSEAAILTQDGNWLPVSLVTSDLTLCDYGEQPTYNYSNFIDKPISLAFKPSPEILEILVGMQLSYGLRELHRNLGRYCSWPYTN